MVRLRSRAASMTVRRLVQLEPTRGLNELGFVACMGAGSHLAHALSRVGVNGSEHAKMAKHTCTVSSGDNPTDVVIRPGLWVAEDVAKALRSMLAFSCKCSAEVCGCEVAHGQLRMV